LKKLSDSASDSDLMDPMMYMQWIGSLMYLVNTRPYIFFAESTLSQYLVEAKAVPLGCNEACVEVPTWYNWIWFVSGGEVRLQGYTDSDWAGSAVDRLSTLGCFFSLGSTMISWFSRKQASVALSTIETEYIATSVTSREAVWLQKLLAGLHPRHGAKGSGEASTHIHR
jgi:hypothetical protein